MVDPGKPGWYTPIGMAKKSTQNKEKAVPVELPGDFVVILDALRRVHHNPPRTQIIQDAVTEMMHAELDENPGLRRKFDAAYADLKRRNIELVETPVVRLPVSDATDHDND